MHRSTHDEITSNYHGHNQLPYCVIILCWMTNATVIGSFFKDGPVFFMLKEIGMEVLKHPIESLISSYHQLGYFIQEPCWIKIYFATMTRSRLIVTDLQKLQSGDFSISVLIIQLESNWTHRVVKCHLCITGPLILINKFMNVNMLNWTDI